MKTSFIEALKLHVPALETAVEGELRGGFAPIGGGTVSPMSNGRCDINGTCSSNKVCAFNDVCTGTNGECGSNGQCETTIDPENPETKAIGGSLMF